MGMAAESLLSMLQPFPSTIYATEGYAPNVPIARKKLEPLGVIVVEVTDDTALPFQDGQFDLIVDQHESYAASEVKKILSIQMEYFLHNKSVVLIAPNLMSCLAHR